MMLLVEDTNFTEMLQYYCISEEFHNYLPFFFKSPPNQFSFGLQFLLKMKKHMGSLLFFPIVKQGQKEDPGTAGLSV